MLEITISDEIDHSHSNFLEILCIECETIICKKLPVYRVDLLTFYQGIIS